MPGTGPTQFTDDQISSAILAAMNAGAAQQEHDLNAARQSSSRRLGAMRKAAAARVALGTEWLTAAQLVARSKGRPKLATSTLGRWIRHGRIFALVCQGVRIYPLYAFDGELKPLPGLQPILGHLGGLAPHEVAAWFESTSSSLDSFRPRELLEARPDAVQMAARRYREGPVHG